VIPSILFINRVYPPAGGATGLVLEHIAQGFAADGWSVTVLSLGEKGASAGSLHKNGVVTVTISAPFSKKNLIARTLGYSLLIPLLLIRSLSLPKADIAVTMTDPPMLLTIGPIIKYLKGSKLIHWAQDLYPEVAGEAGLLAKGGLVFKTLRSLSSLALKFYDLVIVVGDCMKSRLISYGLPLEKVSVIPNTGIQRRIIPVLHEENPFRKNHVPEGGFCVIYSGNMGRAHEFSTLLKAAETLQEMGETKILFLMVGNGPGQQFILEEARRMNLKNIRFIPPQPEVFLSESLSAGDLHLVTMRSGMMGLVVPSKFYGVMAASRACLFVGPDGSEVARVIKEKKVGCVVPPGDHAQLVRVILAYSRDSDRVRSEGERGRLLFHDADSTPLFLQRANDLLSRGP
jgi:colanic acid biosynthesis glycosyl transferase WcaI